MTFQVQELTRGVFKPCNAESLEYTKGIGWDISDYTTKEEAVEYCNKWLGTYAKYIKEDGFFDVYVASLFTETGYCYNGFDYIRIMEIPSRSQSSSLV